jgi:aldehyde:ferredoxin oxidoreductase
MFGYGGRILEIDLSKRTVTTIEPARALYENYIGGSGIAAALFLERMSPDMTPFDPANPLIIMTGPLTGTVMPSTPRFTVSALSPLTGIWGEANIGGYFGPELKFAGYDGIIVTGASSKPVYIWIENDTVEVRDAAHVWGSDTYEATDLLTGETKGSSRKKPQVFTIGTAGEKMVSFASITNRKHHHAGRTGMGAVMGAKKLKAFVVRGTGRVAVAHGEKFKDLRNRILAKMDDNLIVQSLKGYGTNVHMDLGTAVGDTPTRNWSTAEWDCYEELNGPSYNETILTGVSTCYGCPVSCKRVAEVKDGPFKIAAGPGPEYETCAVFGPNCLNSDIRAVAKMNDLCNRYGMDTISCGATVAWAMECYGEGILSSSDLDGIELTWGNAPAMVSLIEKIGRREGIGDILANGSREAANIIGKGSERFLTAVKGLEAPMHDPRGTFGLGLGYATSVRGACHMASLNYVVEGGSIFFEDIDILNDPGEMTENEGKARLTVTCQDFGMFFHCCAIFCNLGGTLYLGQEAVDAVNFTCGTAYTIEDLMRKGEHIWHLKRGIGNVFGAGRKDDLLPPKLATPLQNGMTEGLVPDVDMMREEFYRLRDIDPATGIVRKRKLLSLKLDKLGTLLYDD